MRPRLMYLDRDYAPEPAAWFHADIERDLSLDVVIAAMASNDAVIADVAKDVLLSAGRNDITTVRYRQDVLRDALAFPGDVRELYGCVRQVLEARRRRFGYGRHNPGGVLYAAVDVLDTLLAGLRQLRTILDRDIAFTSRGMTTFVALVRAECDDPYLDRMQAALTYLKFKHGVLISAQLGPGNQSVDHVLRSLPPSRRRWLARLRSDRVPEFTFRVADRDEAGARAVRDIRNRGVNDAANATAHAADHVTRFFELLQSELAFYVGAVTLHERLQALGAPAAFPVPEVAGSRRWHCLELYDVGLALHTNQRPVGNALDADGTSMFVITGANQGGKSTFLRSMGLAQLMMQSGLFVGAEQLSAELCGGLFTHYRREEDATMTQGRLDEELARLSRIVDTLRPGAMVLFNESFATTNEREGSEIARQVMLALASRGIKVVMVTHLYDLARRLSDDPPPGIMFLRAERCPDGTRTFRLVPGIPLDTSYGADLYRAVFGDAAL